MGSGLFLVVTAAIHGWSINLLNWPKAANYAIRALFDGEEEFACWEDELGQSQSIHEDLDQASDTLSKLRALEQLGCHIVLSHDTSWMLSGKNQVLMSLLSDDMKEFAKKRLPIEGFP